MRYVKYILIFLIFVPLGLFAQLYEIQTPHLRLITIGKSYDYLIAHAARSFENAYRFHSHFFDYQPSEKITVFLQDFWDYGNAGATAIPRNRIRFGIAPLNYVFETSPANERMNHTMNHELVHVVMMDKAAGSERLFRRLFFGKVMPISGNPLSMFYSYLTTPRVFSPRWYHEGIAVFFETWLAGGLGRALGPYDEMVFRTKVRDNDFIYDVVSLESEGTTIDFQVGVNSYLYGTRFVSYLAYRYGVDSLLQWYNRAPGSKRYFAAQFKNIYGVSLREEWSRWKQWERQFQQENLKAIRRNPQTPFRVISRQQLGSVSRAFYDSTTGKLYCAVNYPGQIAHLAEIDVRSGELSKLSYIKGAALFSVTSIAFDPFNRKVFFTTDNNRWRDLNMLNLNTRQLKLLQKDVRVGDLTFNRKDRSLWGVRHENGISTIVRIPPPYSEWNQIYSLPYGQDIYDIDISPDGRTLVGAFAEINGEQKLVEVDISSLQITDDSFQVLFNFENTLPENFVFTPDGKFLFGSSYYSGVSNIYRYDLNKRDMDIISNCETGFFRPVPFTGDSLIVFRYTGKGFVPVVISISVPERVSAVKYLGNELVRKYPQLKTWMLGSPRIIQLDSLIQKKGEYHSFRSMLLNSIYPVVEGYKDFPAYGFRFNLSDPLYVSGLDATVTYTPNRLLTREERWHVKANFNYWHWKIFGTYNGSDFYDLFGPTKVSRKGYSIGVQYRKSLIYDQPRKMDLSVRIAGYGNLERLPDYQNVNATFDKMISANVLLKYDFRWISLGAVDYERGMKWQLGFRNNLVNRVNYPRLFATLDYGVPLPLNHSSIWLRVAGGASAGDKNNPFANFFFGGFGNNWVDYQTEKRYREYYSFPGVELNYVGGTNFVKGLLEWNLPPLRFSDLGSTFLYFNWIRSAIFASGLQTNMDGETVSGSVPQFGFKRTLFNLGTQLDMRFILLSHLRMTLSVGYGIAFEKNQNRSSEFMISLKIL